MKLIFVKYLKNSPLCYKIFNHLLECRYKNNSKSFISVFNSICENLNMDKPYVINNIDKIVDDFKTIVCSMNMILRVN